MVFLLVVSLKFLGKWLSVDSIGYGVMLFIVYSELVSIVLYRLCNSVICCFDVLLL